MTANVFIDTNLYIYALVASPDKADEQKSEEALALFKTLLESHTLITSVQVLNELHSNLIKKFKLDDNTAFQAIEQSVIPITLIKPISYQTYQTAFQLRTKYSVSYWDSLIIASALENDCNTLYSEDMQHQLTVEKKLTIINPFQQHTKKQD